MKIFWIYKHFRINFIICSVEVRRVILASCMNHKMNELLYHLWIRNLRHPVEMRKFFVAVAKYPILCYSVSRVSKKISFKDNMECIVILRHSWMIHDTFWRKQIGRTSYFWTKSDANKDGSVMKCITLKIILLTIFLEVNSFFVHWSPENLYCK